MAKRLAAAIVSTTLAALPAAAAAQVTKPFPGVTLVRHGGRAMAIADLCAPGVSIRATKYAERKATAEGWASRGEVAADVAVNADFFDNPGATRVNGRARGAGEDWPADKQFYEYNVLGEVRSYWQFGAATAAHVEPSTTAPLAPPTATEIVGAHNVIVRGGKSLAPDFDGDAVVLNAYRRTGIGVSKDRSKVYLFASNDALSGAAMADTMLAYAAEGGAADLDVATNEDGGGSSQMYVRGQGQIVPSSRLVANHLGIVARGSGASPMCPTKPPASTPDAGAARDGGGGSTGGVPGGGGAGPGEAPDDEAGGSARSRGSADEVADGCTMSGRGLRGEAAFSGGAGGGFVAFALAVARGRRRRARASVGTER